MPQCMFCGKQENSVLNHMIRGWKMLTREGKIVKPTENNWMEFAQRNGRWVGVCPDCLKGIRDCEDVIVPCPGAP